MIVIKTRWIYYLLRKKPSFLCPMITENVLKKSKSSKYGWNQKVLNSWYILKMLSPSLALNKPLLISLCLKHKTSLNIAYLFTILHYTLYYTLPWAALYSFVSGLFKDLGGKRNLSNLWQVFIVENLEIRGFFPPKKCNFFLILFLFLSVSPCLQSSAHLFFGDPGKFVHRGCYLAEDFLNISVELQIQHKNRVCCQEKY